MGNDEVNSRVLSVYHEVLGVMMNIYATNKRRDREKLFAGLQSSTADLTTNAIVEVSLTVYKILY